MKIGENDFYKLARLREKGTRELGNIMFIKSEDNKVHDIQESWKSYFNKCLMTTKLGI